MRNRFDEQLFLLKRELIEMGSMCEEAILNASHLVDGADKKLIEQVKINSRAIDQIERNIENRCMKLLLHEQPVASDLRLISAALKMITDMERIGDQAEDIAEITKYLNGEKISEIEILKDMAKQTIKMLSKSVDAFVKSDISLAKTVIEEDDIVDNYFSKIKCGIISLISENNSNGELALDMLMIAKYLERIGDHATNIAEWVIYSITGSHEGGKK